MEIELGAEEVAFGIFGYAGDASGVVVFLIGVEGLPYHIFPGDVFNTEDISFGIHWQGAPFVIVGDIAIAAKVDIAGIEAPVAAFGRIDIAVVDAEFWS